MKLFNEIKSDQAGRVVRVDRGGRRAGQGQAAAHRGGAAVSAVAMPPTAPAVASRGRGHARVLAGTGASSRRDPPRAHHRLGLRTRRGRAHERRPRADRGHLRRVDRHAAPGSASGASRPPTRRPPRMAAVAGARAIAVAGLDPDEIDLILVATLTPDYWMPSTAALVKEAIGNTPGGRDGRLRGVLRLRLRLRDRPRLRDVGHGPPRPRHRRRAAHPLPRLHRPQHLHPVRRRRRGGGRLGLRRAGRPARDRADDRPGRAPT